jgi:lysophospholipase L1-like esterase
MQLQLNQRLLFIGDSITDCGRKRPIGQGSFTRALGDGYVSLVDAAFTAAYPDYAIEVLNLGVSGNTVLDLEARWKTDVLDLEPDWLSIMIGINDVWQHFGFLWEIEHNVSGEAFAHTLDDLIRQVRPSLQGLVLMTPYYLEPNSKEPLRAMMDEFGEVVKEAAARHDALLVDTQAAFDRVMQWVDPLQLAADRVHINLPGHMVLAGAFLQTIGFSLAREADSK